ncbi:MAG: polymer-forming cytoskeletal protein [Acidobacteria bacterium]|nr:polymer-forming cytoskeletal protein [Acidobacteriota bacterium]
MATARRRLSDRFTGPGFWTEEATVVGPQMVLEGSLRAAGPVVIAGRIEGPVKSAGPVRVARGAVVRGAVEALAVLVEGAIEGDVLAHEQFELDVGARVIGDITGPRLALAEGAEHAGRLVSTGGAVHIFRERRKPKKRR